MGILGIVLGLLFFVGLIAVIGVGAAWAVRRLSAQGAPSGSQSYSLAIARRRKSAGEITAAEYDEIHERLRR
jgi:uncharacterized membrane protein